MKQCVKIIQCSNPIMWYKDLIGECYEVKFIDDYDNSFVVDLADSTGNMGGILPQDVEMFEIDDEESARPFVEILTESQLEHLDALEALATVYEELMMLRENMQDQIQQQVQEQVQKYIDEHSKQENQEDIDGGTTDDTGVCEADF